ncbi:50 kDa hatching enzyme [Octopus sinensis]|uniref:50 kDa hatching enzyme n=1 Tax=Octopus sinensis TaxID=2607531 RepID=A0A6P7U938_9MOLL|nr:50 kDa hatching enzyme [Octopus sinensis]
MVRNTRLTRLIGFMLLVTTSLGEKSTQQFFEQFGYLPERSGSDRTQAVSPETLEKAVSKFQEFNGLKVTGILDDMTKKKMFEPRCGVKDFSGDGAAFRKITKWKKNDLTWSVRDFSRTTRLTRLQQLNAIRKALNHWSSVTQLTFREVPHGGDIVIRFVAGDHGDGNSFDGPGSVLAHAFFPSNGDTHFDDSEKWTLKTNDGIDLEIVAAHEFGHALGLAHSQVSSALMAPYYKGYIPDFKLDNDDIRGIQSLYGVRRRVTRPTTRPTTTRHREYGTGYCRYRYNKISALVRVLGRIDYVFVDQEYVISSKTARMDRIRSVFERGPLRVEAAVYSKETNKVYLAYGTYASHFLLVSVTGQRPCWSNALKSFTQMTWLSVLIACNLYYRMRLSNRQSFVDVNKPSPVIKR